MRTLLLTALVLFGAATPASAEVITLSILAATGVAWGFSAATVVTDGAVYEPDGTLLLLMPKVALFPHLNAIMAMRGPVGLLHALALSAVAAIGKGPQLFDYLKLRIAPVLQEHYPTLLRQMPEAAQSLEMDFVVAGISEATGPDSYCVSSHDGNGPAWQVRDCGPINLTPGDAEMAAEVFPPGMREDQFDIVGDGLRIMELQRKRSYEHAGNAAASYVGGFVQLTSTSYYGGVTTRVLHRWPDAVGRRIGEPAMPLRLNSGHAAL